MKFEKNIILIMVILLLIMQNIIGEIKKGEEAPLFSLPDVSNQYIALRDLCGEKLRKPWKNKVKHVVVLSFLPVGVNLVLQNYLIFRKYKINSKINL